MSTTVLTDNQWTVICDDESSCTNTATAVGATYEEAYEALAGQGWSINEHSRGAYAYCPTHADKNDGRTPRGRRLMAGYTYPRPASGGQDDEAD